MDRQTKKAREKAVEAEVHAALRDRSMDLADRALAGFAKLADKLIADVNEKLDAVQALESTGDARADAVDAEVARLLRMLDKRKKLFEDVERAISEAEASTPRARDR